MGQQKRVSKVLFWCCGVSGLLIFITHCGIGGKLGNFLLAIFIFTILRNIITLLVLREPFRLEEKPLPPSLYLLPSPAPPTLRGNFILYAGTISSGLLGWILGGEQIINPIINSLHYWITLIIGGFIGLIYALIILEQELTYPYFLSLEDRPHFSAHLMAISGIFSFLIIVCLALGCLIWLFKI